ncbi:MAG: DUF3261 domain-containing protein [Proteobacteria bacterium]|nr:DUF3261 domain-containing protein [Cystobacterineae bacterium]MCL2313971.1 DUF3261 domain-containing protein [Pseudomonadota bacterium]
MDNPSLLHPSPWLLLLLLPSWLGCPAHSPQNGPPAVYFSNQASFSPLPPQYIEKPMDMLQRISGSHGDKHFHMSAWVKANNEEMVMEFWGDMGNSLGTFHYNHQGLHFSSSAFPQHFRPEYVLADFQLCFYSPMALRNALGKLTLYTQQPTSGVEIRRLYEGETCLVEIEKTPHRVHYKNHLRGYAYSIEGDFP